MTAAVETDCLTHRYGRKEAVSELSFQVPESSIYAFLGPNGAGKTTTIKILMNLLRPSGGHAAVLGIPSSRLGPEGLQNIGYVSENQKLPEEMTLEQLAAFCAPLYPKWDDRLCSDLIRRFDLPRRQKIRSFSRGMKMKTAMVMSLAYRPRLLILDEPFSGLDPVVRDEIVEGMLEIAGRGEWSVLLSSHDLSEVENLADHVGFIRQGRMIVSEPLELLQGRFREVEVTLAYPRPRPEPWPAAWLNAKTSERVVRFVESQYDEARTAGQVRQLFDGAEAVVSPVSLREIFVALAREERGGGANT